MLSTPVVDYDLFPDLPPSPWPEPDAAFARQVSDLELSDAATSCQPVVSMSQQYLLVLPTARSRPIPEDLRELLTPSAMPLPAHGQLAPSNPRVPAFFPQSEPTVRPVVPSSESVYRGPPPMVPKFTNPDPSEFARLRIALENLLPPDGTELFNYQILVDHLNLRKLR